MIRKSRSVPVRGDVPFVKAIKVMAAENGQDMADYVRDTLIARDGEKLLALEARFAASNGSQSGQSEPINSTSNITAELAR
jgi:microcompartment protein CcmL/EutN